MYQSQRFSQTINANDRYSSQKEYIRSKIEQNTEIGKLFIDNKSIKNRRCQNWYCVFIPLIEVILVGVCFYLSTTTNNFETKINLNEGLQVLTSKSDILQRQCGFDKTKKRYDLHSPNIQNLLNQSQEDNIYKQNLISLCNEFSNTYSIQFNCQEFYSSTNLDQIKYNEFISKLYDQLPQVQSMAVYTDNGIICTQDLDYHCDLIQYGDYLCLQEFFDIAQYNNISITNKNQLISSQDYENVIKTFDSMNLTYMKNMCQNIQTNKYVYQQLPSFQVCTVDQTYSITKIITDYIEIPEYINYLIQYFMQFSSNFIAELEQHWKSICFTSILTVIYSYVGVFIITTLAATVMTISSLLPAIGLGIVEYFICNYLITHFNDDNYNWQTFGYNKISQYFLFGILLIFAILFGVGTICVLVLIYPIIKFNYKNSQMIKICSPVLRKRLRMLFVPILFTIILIGLMLGFLYIIFMMIYNASFDSQLSVVSFQYITEDYEIKTDVQKIILIVISVITALNGVFFIIQSNQYFISNLTYIYYLQRISPQYSFERYRYITNKIKDKNTDFANKVQQNALNNYKRQLEKQLQKMELKKMVDSNKKSLSKQQRQKIKEELKKCLNQVEGISQGYYDIGLRNSYKLVNKYYMMQIGALFFISFMQVILFIPKIFLYIIQWIQKQASLQRFSEQRQLDKQRELSMSGTQKQSNCCSCCKNNEIIIDVDQKITLIEKILNTSKKLTVQYLSLTGCGIKNAVLHSNYLYHQNTQLLNTESRINNIMCISIKIIIVIGVNLSWALWIKDQPFLQNDYQYSTQEYPITGFIIITIMSFIISNMIIQLIDITNMSMMHAFNFENMILRQNGMLLSDRAIKQIEIQTNGGQQSLANGYNQDLVRKEIYKQNNINLNITPEVLKNIIEQQHLQEPNKVFTFKPTITTILFE